MSVHTGQAGRGRGGSGGMRGIAGRGCRGMSVQRGFVSMDSWESRAAYEEFRETFAAEYARLDRECEGMTVRDASGPVPTLTTLWRRYYGFSRPNTSAARTSSTD